MVPEIINLSVGNEGIGKISHQRGRSETTVKNTSIDLSNNSYCLPEIGGQCIGTVTSVAKPTIELLRKSWSHKSARNTVNLVSKFVVPSLRLYFNLGDQSFEDKERS